MTEGVEDRDLLIRRATFGKQVDIFMSSDIGRYMVSRATDEAEEALQAFKTCDPTDTNKVRELQHTILQAEKVKRWLEDAVQDGLQAINIIEDRG